MPQQTKDHENEDARSVPKNTGRFTESVFRVWDDLNKTLRLVLGFVQAARSLGGQPFVPSGIRPNHCESIPQIDFPSPRSMIEGFLEPLDQDRCLHLLSPQQGAGVWGNRAIGKR